MVAPLSCSPKGVWAFLLLCATTLSAQQQYELYADRVSQEGNTTRASGDVLLRDGSRFLRANRLIFCQQQDEAEMFGNVYFSDPYANTHFVTDYLRLKTQEEEAWSDNLFAHFNESGLWLSGDEGHHAQSRLHIQKGALSGCNPHSPDWSIRFSSATHDQEKQWLNLYNARLYAGHVPVLYTPYFGHSTDTRRRSGLLFPRFGHSRQEGTLYEQPLYIAPQEWWDLELWHQTRSRRGEGVAGTFRFVDSPYSKGEINAGEFREKRTFMEEHNIKNERHTGLEFDYERRHLLTQPRQNRQEGLRIRYQAYSDVDYLQVESLDPQKRDRPVTHTLTDEVDYFYKADEAYGGLYVRHFKDVRDPDRKDLVQIMPEAHGHLFTQPLLGHNLLYSIDLRQRNYTRGEGLEAEESRILVPVGYHRMFLGDYLQLSAGYQMDYYQVRYSDNTPKGIDTRESVSIRAGSLVAKGYEELFHTVGISTTYNEPLNYSRKGEFYNEFSAARAQTDQPDASLSLGLSQYLHRSTGQTLLTHRLSQAVLMDDNRTLLELENEIIWNPTRRLSLRNISRYSHEHDALVRSSTTLSLSGQFGYALTYLYRNPEGQGVDQRYLNAAAHYRLNTRHRFEAALDRDLLEEQNRGLRLAHQYNKGCWLTELSFARTITPYGSTTGATDSRTHDIIFLKLTLVPLGELIQQLYEEERG